MAHVWPAGTMLVLTEETAPGDGGHARPRGACGIVIKAPEADGEPYRVRFPDGAAFNVPASVVEPLKHYQNGLIGDTSVIEEAYDLRAHVIYDCLVGSKAYGLDHDGSDTDRRGFYLPPAELHWSLFGVPGQLEDPVNDRCYWELEKFLQLALKANPNVLECLYSPKIIHSTPLADALIAQREIFLSKMIYQTYNRYVMSQFKTMNRKLEQGEQVKPKHAMHLIRLMLSGITILTDGFVPLAVDEHRERLLAIRDGLIPWSEADAWRLALHAEFDAAFEATSLPEKPDYAAANAFLVRARRWASEQ